MLITLRGSLIALAVIASSLFFAPKAFAALTIGSTSIASDSNLTLQPASNVGIGNANPQALLHLGTAGSRSGIMKLDGATSGTVTIQPAAVAGTWTLTLPSTAGANGQVLTTNGSGISSWTTIAGGGVVDGQKIYDGNHVLAADFGDRTLRRTNGQAVLDWANQQFHGSIAGAVFADDAFTDVAVVGGNRWLRNSDGSIALDWSDPLQTIVANGQLIIHGEDAGSDPQYDSFIGLSDGSSIAIWGFENPSLFRWQSPDGSTYFDNSGFNSALKTPSSSSASCRQGQIEWDANFIYVCTATNTWKRSALSTW